MRSFKNLDLPSVMLNEKLFVLSSRPPHLVHRRAIQFLSINIIHSVMKLMYSDKKRVLTYEKK